MEAQVLFPECFCVWLHVVLAQEGGVDGGLVVGSGAGR